MPLLRPAHVFGAGLAFACSSTPADNPPDSIEPATRVEASANPAPPEPAPAVTAYDGPPKTVLLELFSSQGCNSCPAADALIGDLASLGFDGDAVVPLTFHVTYWDDLGWSDPFASALHDQRQIAYGRAIVAAKADDETTIEGPYTPQMIVDGRVHFSGSLRDVARAELSAARNHPTLIELSVEARADGETVAVDCASIAAPDAGLDTDRRKVGLFAALAQRALTTEVPRGENAGATLEEFSVVRALAGPKLFRASRENDTRFELALPEGTQPADHDVVVFAQDLASLRILATARVDVSS